ncbi:hypothetical protein Tco_0907746 [Tanacetum coccineum]|uniref:RNA-directed DNA polymerase, eukaryota n=1 Tax=Tanacetum coccineum TaxID=301880 RepID=A0ABQ5CK53_9ASTR
MTNNLQTNTTSSLHNAIMEAGGKDRPPMLAPGNYVQWKSRIRRYIDTKPNRELIHYCIENEPYQYQDIVEIRKKIDAEAKAVHIILTGINNDIYSTVDACPNAKEMWKEIERLKLEEKRERSLDNNSYVEEYDCSSLALD